MKKQILFNETQNPFLRRRADGAEAYLSFDAESRDASAQAAMLGQLIGGRSLSRRPGIHVGDWFVSAELLVLTATFVAILVGLRRR